MNNFKKLSILFGLVALCTVPVGAHAYIDHSTAVVRVMNKAAGKTQTVSIPVGRTVRFEKMDMTVRACKQTDPFQAQDFFMFIEIAQDKPLFGGWMSHNEPGDNPLQHPDYDVWLVECK